MKDYKLSFNEEEVNLLLGALGELQAKTSISLILSIHKQVNEANLSDEKTQKPNPPKTVIKN